MPKSFLQQQVTYPSPDVPTSVYSAERLTDCRSSTPTSPSGRAALGVPYEWKIYCESVARFFDVIGASVDYRESDADAWVIA